MKTRNLLAVLASAFMLTACNNESPDTYPNWYPDSYIIGFEGVGNLDASALHLKFFNLENKTMDIAVAGKQELPTTLSIIGNITDNATTKVDFLAKDGTEQAAAYKKRPQHSMMSRSRDSTPCFPEIMSSPSMVEAPYWMKVSWRFPSPVIKPSELFRLAKN